MKKLLILHIFIFCVFGTGDELRSEEKKISLSRCLDIALQHHPSLQVSGEDKKVAFAQYNQFKAKRNPQLYAQIKTLETAKDGVDTEFKIPGVDTNITIFGGLYATYKLFDPTISHKEKASRLKLDVSKISLIKLKNKIILDVKKSYYGYLIASENVKIKKQLLEKYNQKKKQAEILFKTGLKPKLDISTAEVNLAEAQLNLEKARNNMRSMLFKLYTSMGIKQSSLINIEPVLIEKLPALKYNGDELKKLAHLYNPDIKLAATAKKASRIKIDLVKSTRLPMVDFNVLLGIEMDRIYGMDNDLHLFNENFAAENWVPRFAFNIVASIPVYTGGYISAQIDESVAEYNKSVLNERQRVIAVNNEITKHYKSLAELKKQLDMTKLILDNSKKHLLLSIRTYENGAGSLLSLKDAQMSVDNAELGYLQVKYQYMITLAELANIIGLDEEYICKNGNKKK